MDSLCLSNRFFLISKKRSIRLKRSFESYYDNRKRLSWQSHNAKNKRSWQSMNKLFLFAFSSVLLLFTALDEYFSMKVVNRIVYKDFSLYSGDPSKICWFFFFFFSFFFWGGGSVFPGYLHYVRCGNKRAADQ